jgi:hypothetical protein
MNLINKLKLFFILVLSLASIIPNASYAWSNYFRFVNNFNVPLVLTVNPTISDVNNLCGGSTSGVEVNPHSVSCEFEFNTNIFHIPNNAGTITVAKKEDPTSFCVFSYSYTESILSYFDMRSEIIAEPTCYGNLKSNELSLINDHIQALPRPLVGNIILGLDQGKSYKFTQSLSEADCGGQGGDNCIIASPDLDTAYVNNGSSLKQSIVLQNELDRYEPLNFEQMIGSHNSAISRHYTKSTSDYNMSRVDPDSYATLTEQLNAGLRQIELDIEWYNNTITVCHNHVSKDIGPILCQGNPPLKGDVLNEIKSWVEKNPNAFIILFVDTNLPLTGHIAELDEALATLEPHIFTPAMAQQYYHVSDNTLPFSQLTQDDIIQKYKKNIVITHNEADDLKTSQYVFTNVQTVNVPPLEEQGVDTILQSNYSDCSNINKYSDIKNLYSDDPNHLNMLRVNGDRTTINYISCVESKNPDQYSDYFTTANIPNMLNCPFNIFSTNMFGFTCDSTNCKNHSTDPRLYSFLWSWELGYPIVNNGSDIAYIDPKTGHFKNESLAAGGIYGVLCVKPMELQSPVAPLSWSVETVKISDLNTVAAVAQDACARAGTAFAVPTTSYWMNDALTVIRAGKLNQSNVLVNYQKVNGQWTPNLNYAKVGQSLVTGNKSKL